MGSRGPAPKRTSQRRRRNKTEPVDTAAAGKVAPPRVNGKWHPIAKRWFHALKASGQSQFYEQSDWALAEVLAEQISRELRSDGPMRAASLQTFMQGCSALLVAEGDRRRARLELERPAPDEGDDDLADVSELADMRRRLRGA